MFGYISLVERSQMGAIGRAYHKFMMAVACLRVCVLFFVGSCKKSKFFAGQWYTQGPVVGGRVEDEEDKEDHRPCEFWPLAVSRQFSLSRPTAYSKKLQTARVRSIEGYLGEKGQQQILEPS